MKLKILCILLVLLLLLAGCGGQEETIPTQPGFQQGDTQPPETTLPPVEITMPEYSLSYSGTLADKISTETHEDGSGILFYVQLSTGKVPMFDMFYNSQDGELVKALYDAAGNRVLVAFQMLEVPAGVSEEDQYTFYTVQEAVNEIVDSLVLK